MAIEAIAYARTGATSAMLAAQTQSAEIYAHQNGMTIRAFYKDIATGEMGAEQHGLKAALDDMQTSGTRILIVEDISRLSRNREDLSRIRDILTTHNAVVHQTCASSQNCARRGAKT